MTEPIMAERPEMDEQEFHVAVQMLRGQPAYAIFTAVGEPRMATAQREDAMGLNEESDPEELTWVDIELGIEGPITAVHWLSPSRLYFAADGDIWLCGDVLSGSPDFRRLFTGSFDITGFAPGANGVIYAYGEHNILLKELASRRNTFIALAGPRKNASLITALVESDGILWLAAGEKVWRSPTKAVLKRRSSTPDQWEHFVSFPSFGPIGGLNYNPRNQELHLWWKDKMIAVFERELVQLSPDDTYVVEAVLGEDEET